jgi:transposase, IS30 family
MHRHISRDDRAVIAALRRKGTGAAEIARVIGKHRSSIGREVARNRGREGYRAIGADIQARDRRKASKLGTRLVENDAGLISRLEARLEPLVSPEVVAHDERISFGAIYAWLYRSRTDLLPRLPQRGKKRRRYGSKRSKKQGWTVQVRPIENRPPGAEHRSRVGHYEGDTIRGTHGALLTHTDRKSRFEIAIKVPDEGADAALAAITGNKHLKEASSITYDRGSTFALWKMIEASLKILVYFASPYHPWERGTNENSNGRLRRVFPKGTDFDTVTEEEVERAVWTMNHTKRKCLGWRTPCSVFGRCCDST